MELGPKGPWGLAGGCSFPAQSIFSDVTTPSSAVSLSYPGGHPPFLPTAEATGQPQWQRCWVL